MACFHSELSKASWIVLGSTGLEEEQAMKTFFLKMLAFNMVIIGCPTTGATNNGASTELLGGEKDKIDEGETQVENRGDGLEESCDAFLEI